MKYLHFCPRKCKALGHFPGSHKPLIHRFGVCLLLQLMTTNNNSLGWDKLLRAFIDKTLLPGKHY